MHSREPVSAHPTLQVWACIAALAALTALAYGNCGSEVFVGYNALRSIRDNPDIQQLWPLPQAMSLHLTGAAALGDGGTLVRRPVLSLSFAISHALGGGSPSAYQAGNVLIHLWAGVTLFGILRRSAAFSVAKAEGQQFGLGFAFAVAALWLVHPLQTESVTYIPQRAESLAGLFVLLTLYCAVRSFDPRSVRQGAWRAGAVTACALAMATKEIAAVTPMLVWLYDAIIVERSLRAPLRTRRSFYLALAATWSVLIVLMLVTWSDARLDFQTARMWPYALSQPGVVLHYLRLAFWPAPLGLYVNSAQFWFDTAHPDWLRLLTASALLAGLLGATLVALRRRHWLGFAGVWFFLILAPTSTLIATSDVIQEHRMYLSLAAPIAVAVAAAHAGLKRIPRMGAALGVLALSVALASAISLTRTRNLDYHTEFGAYAPADLPGAYGVIAHYELVMRRDYARAAGLFTDMLDLALPAVMTNYGQLQFHRVRVINALGVIDALQGHYDSARSHFLDALKALPDWPVARANDGVVTLMDGALEQAQQKLGAAWAADPEMQGASAGLALIARADKDARDELATPAARQQSVKLWLSAPGFRIFDYILIPLLARDYGG